MRKGPTDAEEMLWCIVRGRQLARWKFRRQHRLDAYIVDFYCPRLHLGIELDGEPHFTADNLRFDVLRSESLARMGVLIVRFENRDVVANPAITAAAIARLCLQRADELRLHGAPQLS